MAHFSLCQISRGSIGREVALEVDVANVEVAVGVEGAKLQRPTVGLDGIIRLI
jgi:hypothetical protein